MVIHIKRDPNGCKTFSVKEQPELTSILKVSDGYLLHNLQIHKNGIPSICVKQPDILRRIFFLFAFLWKELPPLELYRDNRKFGYSTQLKSTERYCFTIENLEFVLLFHSENYISIWLKDRQIALIHTDGSGNYEIKYDLFMNNEPELLLLFCVIIDCYQFQHFGNKVHYFRFAQDPYKNAINWVPSNE